MTDRSIDIYLTTEDLPSPDNRVRVDGDRIVIDWTPNNLAPHANWSSGSPGRYARPAIPMIFTERMGIATNSHMCGTAVAGTDPARSVLDVSCRSHDVENLFRGRRSFFPSSAALNPALTIAANALRVAPPWPPRLAEIRCRCTNFDRHLAVWRDEGIDNMSAISV